MRGIALLCVEMLKHHTFQREKIAMQLNQVANQLQSCVAKLLSNGPFHLRPWNVCAST